MAKEDIFKTIANIKAKYPEDLERIEKDVESIRELLSMSEYVNLEGSKRLRALCERDIAYARAKLSTDKTLIDDPKAARELWLMIESRQWVLQFFAKDYQGEIESMHNSLLGEL